MSSEPRTGSPGQGRRVYSATPDRPQSPPVEGSRKTSLLRRTSTTTETNDGRPTRPKRQKSLVRPERERINADHRQYHYRQHVAEQLESGWRGGFEASTTGNAPLYNLENGPRGAVTGVWPPQPLYPSEEPGALNDHTGRTTPPTMPMQNLNLHPLLKRGKSILGREEPQMKEKMPETKSKAAKAIVSPFEPPAPTTATKTKKIRVPGATDQSGERKWPDCWQTYCRLLTCCIPGGLLELFGMPNPLTQKAWREKIGLLSIIFLICGAVGFLTFGFTQAVCPTPPLTFRIGTINPGYLIINGWAYQLASWSHPPIPGFPSNMTNILYPPINAGGMDATFLFQNVNQQCLGVITPKAGAVIEGMQGNKVPTYFPCRLFNPNITAPPDPSTYTNYSGCHLTTTARDAYYQMETIGAKDNNGKYQKGGQVYYAWEDVRGKANLVVYNGNVLNLALLKSLPTNLFSTPANGLMQQIINANGTSPLGGTDITLYVSTSRDPSVNYYKEAECMSDIIKVGQIDTMSLGCIASQLVLYLSLCVILGVIIIKFTLAIIFGWFLSWKLGYFKEGDSYKDRMKRANEIESWTDNILRPADAIRPRSYASADSLKRQTIIPRKSRFTTQEFGSTHFDNTAARTSTAHFARSPMGPNMRASGILQVSASGTATPPLRSSHMGGSVHSIPRSLDRSRRSSTSSTSIGKVCANAGMSSCPFPLAKGVVPQPPPDYQPFHFPLIPAICLITCYSEGEEGIRTTLDSIATTDYPNSHKLILIIADGIITGAGNSKPTPDICVDMMTDLIVPRDRVQPYSYVSIADGAKRHNMAKIYAGFYKYDNTTVDPSKQQRVPMITIAKCGTEAEANEKKPGNRGKRDSQIILMNFLQKVMFDERMTLLEYEFFNSIWRVCGISADKFEAVLMVDADTKIFPDSLTRLLACLVKDHDIMGLCGETKIGNKTDSWVSMIQVFEYYISHHQIKAFESIFGGVTCLPGCFCMYRIKAPKGPNGYWVPILANPDVVQHYSENIVDTLHKKNLLLLGEDRYLSTLMLKTFPKRKMVFVPQAVCKTVVPDTFNVLLSQRRRWINSTIHNLAELVFVRDLCGTFCFSMQFIVFMDLVGTVALPAAISFTLYLVIRACLGYAMDELIPLILLAVILGLPAVLIGLTSRKLIYVGWMMVYLLSLPIWNFVLPVYAYWHFDDFTWGDTRKLASGKDTHHGDKEGEFDSSKVIMKRWAEYERERRSRGLYSNLQGDYPGSGQSIDTISSEEDLASLRHVPFRKGHDRTPSGSMLLSPPLLTNSHVMTPHTFFNGADSDIKSPLLTGNMSMSTQSYHFHSPLTADVKPYKATSNGSHLSTRRSSSNASTSQPSSPLAVPTALGSNSHHPSPNASEPPKPPPHRVAPRSDMRHEID
ncbi:hypothetical protein BZG36_02238 [Bifiguratus adelaidae]|uniref:chitin synthase n=1 Tax=Bifiguratus adelaidae TaxID=1938954 RepID=A0A261Y1R1_9FUNG|nr:hypothetical protein BZG36_02238 [Bifiguratus adelaidae]